MEEVGGRGERWLPFVLVVLGGCLGTAFRAGLSDYFPADAGGWPWATFAINLVGALLLGFMLGLLARFGEDSGWRRRVRLGVGTGVLGGFTTYSTFAVEVVERQRDSASLLGFGYALTSVIGGVVLATLGLVLGRGARR